MRHRNQRNVSRKTCSLKVKTCVPKRHRAGIGRQCLTPLALTRDHSWPPARPKQPVAKSTKIANGPSKQGENHCQKGSVHFLVQSRFLSRKVPIGSRELDKRTTQRIQGDCHDEIVRLTADPRCNCTSFFEI